MICPECKTQNRDNRDACYVCKADLKALRNLLNRAKDHYNNAIEHAERGRNDDAITELRHALELDSRFIEAWVLLGTLLAREEQFVEARDAWQTAMQQDPRFLRCHEYLNKAERVSSSLPSIRRLRMTVVGLLLMLVLVMVGSLALIVNQLRSDPASTGIPAALDSIDDGNLGDAIARLTKTSDSLVVPRENRRIAAYLKILLEDKLERDWEEAQTTLDQYHSNELSYDKLEERLLDSIALMGKDPRSRSLQEELDQAKRKNDKIIVAQTRSFIQGMIDPHLVALHLEGLKAQHPDLAGQFDSSLDNYMTQWSRVQVGLLKTELEKGDLAKARALLFEIETAYSSIDREAPVELMAPLRESIAQKEREELLALIQTQLQKEQWQEVVDATQDLDRDDWTDQAWSLIQAQRRKALRQLARDFWNWAFDKKMDVKIENGKVNEKEAERIAKQWKIAFDYYEGKPYFQGYILFYAASTYHYALKDDAFAAGLLQRLENEFTADKEIYDEIIRKGPFKKLKAALSDILNPAADEQSETESDGEDAQTINFPASDETGRPISVDAVRKIG